MVLNKNFEVPKTLELFKSLIKRDEWNCKSPLSKWAHLYGIGRSICKMLEVAAYREDQTLGWFAYYGVTYISAYFILLIYTLAYYTLNGEFSRALPCTCFFVGPVCGVFLADAINFSYLLQSLSKISGFARFLPCTDT